MVVVAVWKLVEGKWLVVAVKTAPGDFERDTEIIGVTSSWWLYANNGGNWKTEQMMQEEEVHYSSPCAQQAADKNENLVPFC